MEKIDLVQYVLYANVFLTIGMVIYISNMRDEVAELTSRCIDVEWECDRLKHREEANFNWGIYLDARIAELKNRVETLENEKKLNT